MNWRWPGGYPISPDSILGKRKEKPCTTGSGNQDEGRAAKCRSALHSKGKSMGIWTMVVDGQLINLVTTADAAEVECDCGVTLRWSFDQESTMGQIEDDIAAHLKVHHD